MQIWLYSLQNLFTGTRHRLSESHSLRVLREGDVQVLFTGNYFLVLTISILITSNHSYIYVNRLIKV